MTKKYAVLGSPIAHSLSPTIHQYIFERLGDSSSYERFELTSGLADFLATKPDYAGFSVTMPLKREAYENSIEKSATAQKTGSVNTLLATSQGYLGFNTDVYGIQQAVGITPKEVAILGSGATAASALASFDDSKKMIFARNSQAARELASQFSAEIVPIERALGADVVISTLPKGVLLELIPSGHRFATLLDAVYTNPELPAGNYIPGSLMLIHQAIAQQRIFQFGDENIALHNESELLEGLIRLLSMTK
jgi:shikimate dehydrogenase